MYFKTHEFIVDLILKYYMLLHTRRTPIGTTKDNNPTIFSSKIKHFCLVAWIQPQVKLIIKFIYLFIFTLSNKLINSFWRYCRQARKSTQLLSSELAPVDITIVKYTYNN